MEGVCVRACYSIARVKMKKVLVVVENYPNNDGGRSLMYVHTRCLAYQKSGIALDVLNFSADKPYTINGISVVNMKNTSVADYSVVVMHAPNIKHHYRLLKKYYRDIPRIILFFHGHEIVRINKTYPNLYPWERSDLKIIVHDVYDSVKLFIWHHFFQIINYKTSFVFVSNSLLSDFRKNVNLESGIDDIHIINNGVAKIFRTRTYSMEAEKKYDFITVRSNLDASTYCIDLLCDVAHKMKQKRFLLIGRGRYFEYNEKPENVYWINEIMDHERLCEYLDQSKCALMFTRRDTQGVMSCELATYGIPLITSDLPVCHEMLDDFSNVGFVNNNDIDIEKITQFSCGTVDTNEKFNEENTVLREIALIKKYLGEET